MNNNKIQSKIFTLCYKYKLHEVLFEKMYTFRQTYPLRIFILFILYEESIIKLSSMSTRNHILKFLALLWKHLSTVGMRSMRKGPSALLSNL
jgi:hypothetical protein